MLIVGGNQSAAGYDIENGLRFNDNSSDNLARTPSTTTNQKTWTWSGWVKRCNLGSFQVVFGVNNGVGDSVAFELGFNSSDQLVGLPWNFYFFITNAVYRDTNAWYHIVFAFDTTQATSTNRFKLYVNGEQVTSFSSTSYPSLNSNWVVNTTASHRIGIVDYISAGGLNRPYDGYVSEVNFIDGQALDPTNFGEFDEDSGVWKPIAYTGSYGTNGFFLEFQSSGALGTDSSGNGNNFTVNNLTSIDQTTDTPTNNFCTWNTLQNGCTLSDGNLRFTSSVNYGTATGTIAVSQGKWYWEVYVVDNDSGGIGIANMNNNIVIGSSLGENDGTLGWVWREPTGVYSLKRINGVSTSYGTLPANGDILGVALDLDAGTLTCYKNNVSQGVLTTGLSGTYAPAVSDETSYGNPNLIANFGSPAFTITSGNSDANGYGNFEYAVPSGYYSLCTKNLAEFG